MQEALEILRWILGGAALLIGVFFSFANWLTFVGGILSRRKGSVSFFPFVGGISLTLALLVLPIDSLWRWSWVGLFIDFAALPIWILCGMQIVIDKLKKETPNKAVDSTATRVTPPAEQESRHGQP